MRKILYVLLSLYCLFFTEANAQSVRQKTRLDKGWHFTFGHAGNPLSDFGCGTEYFNYLTKANSIHNEGPYAFKFDDTAWQEISIPHDWATTLPFAPEASHSHGYKTVGYKYPETSVGWYRKKIQIPATDLGKHISLQFDGIFRNASVWFNGFYMGTEPSGYATQVYDVTEYVNYGGENLICVRADATLEEGWFYEGAGIYRDAWLLKSAAVSVAPFGTFVYSELEEPYDEATITVETEVNNNSLEATTCTVEQRLLNARGEEVGRAKSTTLSINAKQTLKSKQSLTVGKPHLWTTADPYLYRVESTIKVDGNVSDVYETTTGIRHIVFDADKGFLLNGKQLKIKGVNMHQNHAGVGAAIPDALQAWRIRQIKDIGCNAYRASHNPMTPSLLDICDREGILVIEENRLSGINDEHLRLLENMIRRDRNHPCIILWSNGNEEWGLENTVQGTRIAAAMKEYTRQFDPTRPSTMANAGGTELIKGLDVVGFNYILQNDVDNRKRQNPLWKIVGTEETTGCGTRGVYFNTKDEPGHMASMNLSPDTDGTENRIERGMKFYAERPWASGLFYWTGFDYRGEPNPLNYPAHESEFGIFDYCGFPKDEAWYLKSWWTDKPVLHIFPHWNLTGHEGEEVEIWAYSNCDKVELTVNGKRLKRQKMPKYGHLKWQAIYHPGKVVAVGYKNGKHILTETIETTGPASKISLHTDRTRISADGQDVCVVRVEIQDSQNRIVPDACQMLTFTLEGDGRILGAGNGNPSYLGADHPNENICHSFSIPAFNGLAQIIIQGSHTPSVLKLTCSGNDLKPSTVSIETGNGFVTQHDGRLWLNGKEYHYIGTNLWYGAILGSEGQGGDRDRLCRELDELHRMGIDNLRIVVGSDGTGEERYRATPTLQTSPAVYNDTLLAGLDYLLQELGKRGMKTVLYINNSWAWSGGYTFYLEHAGCGTPPDQNDDGYAAYTAYASQFAKNKEAQRLFLKHVQHIVSRTNRYTRLPYADDPTIMAWQIGNEPRAFSSTSKNEFADWLSETSALIRSIDQHHLISTGSEGIWGCDGDEALHRRICEDTNIDYVTAHIWPANWDWAKPDSLSEMLPQVFSKTTEYINRHVSLCKEIGKPLVIEEFGYPRDGYSFSTKSTTRSRDKFIGHILNAVADNKEIAGCNFWAWGGEAQAQHKMWHPGDPLMGDPPQEPQGLYSVFSDDSTTRSLLSDMAKKIRTE